MTLPTPTRETGATARAFASLRIVSLLLATVFLLHVACDTPDSAPAPIVLEVRFFEVEGQDEGAEFVGVAFARSMEKWLAQSEPLVVLDASQVDASKAASVTHFLSGVLVREGLSVRASVRLVESDGDELWTSEASSERGDLSALAVTLARKTLEEMNQPPPASYGYIEDVLGGGQLPASPLTDELRAAWGQREMDRFLEASSSLVEEHPANPAAHLMNAWALLFAWDADPSNEAILANLKQRLDELDRADVSSPYDELLRGYVYRASGNPDLAYELYSRVLSRDDLSTTARAWALRQRSFVYQQIDNTSAACDDAEAAAQLDPSNAASFIALSRALEADGRVDEAIVRSESAVALQPSAWRHHQRLGIVFSRAGRHDEGIRYLDRACTLSDNQEACANLAVAIQRASQPDAAAAAASRAETLTASRWGYYNLACFWALASDSAKALDYLKRSVEFGFADALINTDTDLDSLRADPAFSPIVADVEKRIRSRKQLSRSVFPWQG